MRMGKRSEDEEEDEEEDLEAIKRTIYDDYRMGKRMMNSGMLRMG